MGIKTAKRLMILVIFIWWQMASVYAKDDAKDDSDLSDITSLIDDELAQQETKTTPNPTNTTPAVDRASIPEIFAAADIVHQQDIAGSFKESENNLDVREVEFGFSGYIDWFAYGTALFAVHREADDGGAYKLDLHEVYFDFFALPKNFRARFGKMFLDAGRLNSFHRHDWQFTNAPVIHQNIMNDTEVGEGANDIGLEVAYLMPWPFFQELKVGVFRGRDFGHIEGSGSQKPAPLYLGRLKQFFALSDHSGTEIGFTYLRYQPTGNIQDVDHTVGSDITFRYDPSRQFNFIFTTELWYKESIKASEKPNTYYGLYSFVDARFWRDYSVGYRVDWYQGYFREQAQQQKYLGHAVWFTWLPSEFSHYRLSFEQKNYLGDEWLYVSGTTPETENTSPLLQKDWVLGTNYIVNVQAVFMLGYHKPHRY